MKHEQMSLSTLKGNDVKNRENKDIGKIEDFVVNTQTGEVSYAVLSFGGFLGIGDKYFAVPWQALEVNQAEECFVLDADKEKLENSPGFDKDHWPNFADPTFSTSVNRHYSGVGRYTFRPH